MARETTYTLDFSEIGLSDVPRVGGKNASLGQLFKELRPLGVGVLDGFATTAEAYRLLLREGDLEGRLRSILAGLDVEDVQDLARRAHEAREAILETRIPEEIETAVLAAHERLIRRLGRDVELAVRSSATAEDLPDASFAGQQESFLNVKGRHPLLHTMQACFASLFTDRAIHYRAQRGYDHLKVALSVGVQPMVRSDKGSSGVIFTLDPESGFRNVVVVTGSYGLGEYVVQGVVTPDEWMVFKPTLGSAPNPIIGRRLGTKEVRLVYAGTSRATCGEPTPEADRGKFSLLDGDVVALARWACLIEDHYSKVAGRPLPMDIEWAKDGISGQLFILQARPETVHSAKTRTASIKTYMLTGKHGPPIARGQAVGEKIASGKARIVMNTKDLAVVQPGEVLIAAMTDPDWEPVMKRVSAIVTDRGGRTAHAAIVSRELGLPCIVGTANATALLRNGQVVTVSCAEGSEGRVYDGAIAFEVETIRVETIPPTKTAILLNVGDPDQAFHLAALPSDGVGLARMEFIITNDIGIHPMALARFPNLSDGTAAATIAARIGSEDPREFFIRRLSEGIGRIAGAFHPRPVIVRMSDFKTNEYARLLGGKEFEPEEENPMLGFRGASRYYDPRYREGFSLECAALRRVRNDMGLTNVKAMIPFVRTVEEAKRVLDVMASNGLRQGEDGFEVYAMCEIPANVLCADEFLEVFDGYSIGSNDLTQLVLGVDRDSGTVAHLFDERNAAVRRMLGQVIEAAHRAGKPIGICGQAPSDYPELAGWLVEQGIGSLSLNADALLRTKHVISLAESQSTQAPMSRPRSGTPPQRQSSAGARPKGSRAKVTPC